MTSILTGKSLLLVQRVLYLNHFLQSSISQYLVIDPKETTLAMKSMFFFMNRLLCLQEVFIVARKKSTVDVGQHYTNLSSLGIICNHGLMNPTARITNRATTNFMASLPMIYSLWDVFYATSFLVPNFVMLIFNKLIDYCLLLYTIASI